MRLTILFKRGKVIFKKNRPVGLPGVSKLIHSAISKGQEDQKKHIFLEKKKYSVTGEMDSL